MSTKTSHVLTHDELLGIADELDKIARSLRQASRPSPAAPKRTRSIPQAQGAKVAKVHPGKAQQDLADTAEKMANIHASVTGGGKNKRKNADGAGKAVARKRAQKEPRAQVVPTQVARHLMQFADNGRVVWGGKMARLNYVINRESPWASHWTITRRGKQVASFNSVAHVTTRVAADSSHGSILVIETR